MHTYMGIMYVNTHTTTQFARLKELKLLDTHTNILGNDQAAHAMI